MFQAQNICSNRIHSLKYLGSTTFGSKDIVNRKSEFVAKTQLFVETFNKSKNLKSLKNERNPNTISCST